VSVVTAPADLSEAIVVAPNFVAVKRDGFWRTDVPVFGDLAGLPSVRDQALAEKLETEALIHCLVPAPGEGTLTPLASR
jgi:hypothetical protein